jgi:hypothetical protein
MGLTHNCFGCCNRASIFEYAYRAIAFHSVFGMDRDQNVAALHFIVVLLRFKFWHSHTDHSPHYASHYRAAACAGEGSDDGASSKQSSQSWDRQCSDSYQTTKSGAENYPASGSNRGAFRRFGVLLMSEVPGTGPCWKIGPKYHFLKNPPL